jgi:PAS domain S-box-containing protein
MASRIRDHEWAGTLLGPSEAWSERLKLMVEQVLTNTLVSSLAIGPERILIYNDAAARLYGDRHPDALGSPVPTTFPDTWPVVASLYDRVFSGESVHVPAQSLDLGGGEVFDAYLTPVRDEMGAVNAAHMVGFEISDRLRAEAALRASEERFERALEGGEVGAWELDLVTLEAWRSPQHDRIFGHETPLPRWTYEVFLSHVAPEDRGWVDARFQDAIAADGVWSFECRIQRVDGKRGWIGAQGRIDTDAGGLVRRMKGTVRDITQRKLGEIALRESEERFRGLIEGLGQFSWEARADGTIVSDSPSWRAFTGQSLAKWQGYGWTEAVHPDDRADTEGKWRAAVAAGCAVDAEYRLWHAPSASWRWSNVHVVPITRPDGTIRKWSGVNIDVTDRRTLQARLEILVNELQHRARNLLGVVAAIANRTIKLGGSVEAFEERLQALSRAQGLLSQGGCDTVEVGALVRAELAAHVHEVSNCVDATGPEVHLTARQVQNFALALHELTTNAVKYGALKDDTGHLTITWEVVFDRRERRRLALSWVESGVAVEPEKVTRRGFGTELIQGALAYALQASVDYTLGADGARCRIEMPVS